ncbi:Aste57867_18289 [Aphanomyces stellatus]|uniref:Aste57867_18289 protein n=1 Tax=Aphanomyces stellatus TaxID=120398 RepID=A0A485L9N9_9STRA|nr:hypothetical protein As57867_018227 [Aphanomyces stellatus]VFT95026.1 Aste57867_18289 [Aphanomyces stellatus]
MNGIEDFKTTPVDPRFPTQNQTQHCWVRYNEWALCLKQNGDDEDACKKQRSYARSLCPGSWIEKWDTERDEGNFSGVQK